MEMLHQYNIYHSHTFSNLEHDPSFFVLRLRFQTIKTSLKIFMCQVPSILRIIGIPPYLYSHPLMVFFQPEYLHCRKMKGDVLAFNNFIHTMFPFLAY